VLDPRFSTRTGEAKLNKSSLDKSNIQTVVCKVVLLADVSGNISSIFEVLAEYCDFK